MIIGILSDTHGNTTRTATAAALLQVHQVAAVIHCGDIGNEAVLLELSGAFAPAGVPVYCVPGNVDYEPDLRRVQERSGVTLLDRFGDITLDGKRIAIAHGHDPARLRNAKNDGRYDYVLTGHTHQMEDSRIGGTRIINPGAVHRASEPSVAVLDTARDEVQFIPLFDGARV
jgi:putative phosphoesterase